MRVAPGRVESSAAAATLALVGRRACAGGLRRRSRSSWASSRWSDLLPLDGIPRPVTFYQAVVRTGHQTNGALVLAASRRPRRCGPSGIWRRGRSRRPGSRSPSAGRIRPAGLGGRRLKTVASLDQPAARRLRRREARPARARRPGWPAYVSLTKPRIVVMVLVTVAVGFLLGARGSVHPVDAGADPARHGAGRRRRRCTEPVAGARPRRPDAADRQPRPAQRPLSVRSRPPSSASVLGVAGHADPAASGPTSSAAAVALATLVLYVLVYTPLKPLTTLNTADRRDPGALPPVIGWAAATGTAGHRGLGPLPDRLPLAVPPLPGDRLDLPRRLRAWRASRCCRRSIRMAR